METVMEGLSFNESRASDINETQLKRSHLRRFWKETRHFTSLSSKIFDEIIYENLHGYTLPHIPDSMMVNEKKQTVGQNDIDICLNTAGDFEDKKVFGERNGEAADEHPCDQLQSDEENIEAMQTQHTVLQRMEEGGNQKKSCHCRNGDENGKGAVKKSSVGSVEDHHLAERQSSNQLISNSEDAEINESGHNKTENQPCVNQHHTRSMSETNPPESLGRVRKNSNQIDVTSSTLYKEIYANNLRQYGFLFAKKLGLSNQSPNDLRKSYLMNRQKADHRRERRNSSGATSFADFSSRLSTASSPIINGRRVSIGGYSATKTEENSEINKSHVRKLSLLELSSKPTEHLKGSENISESSKACSGHRRSLSDLTNNKYADSLVSISDIMKDGAMMSRESSLHRRRRQNRGLDSKRYSAPPCIKTQLDNPNIDSEIRDGVGIRDTPSPVRRRKQMGVFDKQRYSAPLIETLVENTKTEMSGIENDLISHTPSPVRRRKQMGVFDNQRYSAPVIKTVNRNSINEPTSDSNMSTPDRENDEEPCFERLNSKSFNDREPSRKTPTTVLRRKHKNIRDPHQRFSVPLFDSEHTGSSSPPSHSRKLSLPATPTPVVLSTMASLSVPDLFHQQKPENEKLMAVYCKQDVPRRKLSMESLRRHNEAKERLEWRISKLKSFESILSEADSFMKDLKTLKETTDVIPE